MIQSIKTLNCNSPVIFAKDEEEWAIYYKLKYSNIVFQRQKKCSYCNHECLHRGFVYCSMQSTFLHIEEMDLCMRQPPLETNMRSLELGSDRLSVDWLNFDFHLKKKDAELAQIHKKKTSALPFIRIPANSAVKQSKITLSQLECLRSLKQPIFHFNSNLFMRLLLLCLEFRNEISFFLMRTASVVPVLCHCTCNPFIY